MVKPDTRKKLIETTKRMLINGIPYKNLTARQISKDAGTNLAMINYYFKSKEELVKISVDEIISEEFYQYSKIDLSKPAKEQLKELLLHISTVIIKYRELTKLSIPYLILNDEISLPFDILPFIKTHFEDTKSDTECKVIAFQIVYMLQLIFYRADDFQKYSGIDIFNTQQLQDFLDIQLNIFLGDD
ncbi:TetR-family transcriptional regulator [Clostridium bornimense]|uniref:TetR-family transcriptional regulator n=1 Tax=Clostridium bornimense TaxID=1216932 RepID=W6RXT4_9CLOT|nr:TetR/AcrR family transcriptional regulator [Clostridium bornimense]CDM68404.1 TetR-family transcriptional regulator [Clostridium bornimense]